MDVIKTTTMIPDHLFGRILLCFTLFGISACASDVHKLDTSNKRFYRYGFSILSPQEPGWRVKEGESKKISFYKKGKSPKSASMVLAYLSKHPLHFDSEAEFELVMGKLRLSKEFRPKQNVLLQKKASLAPDIGKYCLKSYSKLKDFGRKKVDKDNYVVRENFGLLCLHPDDKTKLVNLGVSFRYLPGTEDKAIQARAEKILAGIRLEPLKLPATQ